MTSYYLALFYLTVVGNGSHRSLISTLERGCNVHTKTIYRWMCITCPGRDFQESCPTCFTDGQNLLGRDSHSLLSLIKTTFLDESGVVVFWYHQYLITHLDEYLWCGPTFYSKIKEKKNSLRINNLGHMAQNWNSNLES